MVSLYEVKGVGLVAFVLCLSCGGEATNHGGAGGRGGTGCGGTAVGGAVSCADEAPPSVWASWPMPNPASSGLAQPARYDVDQAGVAVSAAFSGSNAWFVNFGNGSVTDFVVNVGNIVDNEYYVRCVR